MESRTPSSIPEKRFSHLFTIIDSMVDHAVEDVEEDGQQISCRRGCTHCCRLLVEVTWEEAEEIVTYLNSLPAAQREKLTQAVHYAADEARNLFEKRPSSKRYRRPARGEGDIPDSVFDEYFYGADRPCPFLHENACSIYPVRPVACRLHLVTSPPELCAREIENDEKYEVPDRIEQLQDAAEPVVVSMQRDGRWGHLAIMVEEALNVDA